MRLLLQVTSSRYWARVGLFCSLQHVRRLPEDLADRLPEPTERLEQQQLHVNVLVLLGVRYSPP